VGKDVLSDLYKDIFDAQVTAPVRQHRQFRRVDFAVELIYERKIDPRQKLYVGMYIGIGVSAGNLEVVDAVLVYGLMRTTIALNQSDERSERVMRCVHVRGQ
jgi:hypothetical protein